MENVQVEMLKMNPETGKTTSYTATVQNERDERHQIYSLLYEGFRSVWQEREG